MIDAELIRAIRILAVQSVEDASDEDVYAKVCRFYSKEFNTPLHMVEELDPIYVLTHFFQHRYEQLSNGEDNDKLRYEREKALLLWPEDVEKRQRDDEEWVRQLEQEMLAQQQGNANKTEEVVQKAMDDLNLIPDDLKLPDSGSFGE